MAEDKKIEETKENISETQSTENVSESQENPAKPLKQKVRHRFKNFFSEFGKFLRQGNVMDLAVAFVVGAAFKAIVSSLVADIIMPLIAAIGGVSVSDWAVVLNNTADGTPNILHYGAFIQTVIDFVIISLAIFVGLRTLMRMRTFMEKGTKVIKEKVELIIKDNDDDKNASTHDGETK